MTSRDDAMARAARIDDERLAALDRYDILDTPQEEGFDRITRLTRRILDVPMSTIALIDGHRQWFKSRSGVEACETPRGPALCNLAMHEPCALVVPDARADARFSDNPFVLGSPHIRFYAGVPLRTPQGHSIGTLCAMDTRPRHLPDADVEILADLSHIVMSELELRRVAMTDALTGTLSRRAFRDECGRSLSLALRHRHPLSCIMLDLDHFKAVNDGHGHPVGDRVLAEIATACRTELRASDVFGRLGGEEFAVLLPHTDLASAMTVAGKLRAAIARVGVPVPGGLLRVTASFGVAVLDPAAADLDALLENADAALYAAKAEGRDRCVAWRPVPRPQQAVRRRVLKAGRIAFDDGRPVVDCTIRSLSDEGAGLSVSGTAGLPETFTLAIPADGASRACRIALRTDGHLDVVFV
ncbi:sensor domain-containing diguanylate cyclase [Methylobacterium sp. J-068]|uniref:sensor domain-containing diguanylate cyclase n=1 Tax=Methylobacterium sp. J-068 TaxID=2836649 RepID=UPI001FB87FB1|nr:sensor domain-containing diguanylate cyclase [Methylobacterium sp. J-068]MCJ2035794.1 sensor domain-containing diguanylate cyclase [Methylobacterium sp. J-068]